MKTCSKCGETKPIEEFYRHKELYRQECKKCTRLRNNKWLEKNPNYMREYLKNYHLKNKVKIIKRSVDWGKNNITKRRDISKNSATRQRSAMSDCYVKLCLKRRDFQPDQITPELIAAERALIKLKRAVKENDK